MGRSRDEVDGAVYSIIAAQSAHPIPPGRRPCYPGRIGPHPAPRRRADHDAHGQEISRRDFVRGVGGIGLLSAFPTIIPSSAFGANEAIRIGHIGVKNRGMQNLFPLMKYTVAVCDVDKDVLASARARVEKGGRSCKAYSDYRQLLDDKDIDAVVVTTPDHWHALITIDACEAGKDVYCEKPLTLTVAEGQAMVDGGPQAQAGSCRPAASSAPTTGSAWPASSSAAGRLGKIQHGPGRPPRRRTSTGPAVPDTAPPPELDYDFWLGPAPERPYNEKRVHYLFRFFWDYSGGQMTNFGAHHLDIAQWGLGRDESGPVAIEGTGHVQQGRLVRGRRVEPRSSTPTTTASRSSASRARGARPAAAAPSRARRGRSSSPAGRSSRPRPRSLKEPLARDDVHLYVSKRPPRQLARLHQEPRAADLRRGDRPPLGDRLPPGQHRRSAPAARSRGTRRPSRSSATPRPPPCRPGRIARRGSWRSERRSGSPPAAFPGGQGRPPHPRGPDHAGSFRTGQASGRASTPAWSLIRS